MVWSCRGHSPPLSHTGQSSGWLTRRHSRTPSCAFVVVSLPVGAASTVLPLMVRTTTSAGAWTSDTGGRSLRDVRLAVDGDRRLTGATAVGEELVLEPDDGRRDGRHGRRAQRADRGLPRRPGDP